MVPGGRGRAGSAVRLPLGVLLVAAAAGLAACSAGGGAPPGDGLPAGAGVGGAKDGSGPAWIRHVRGFIVRDSAGRPLSYPFLGGFDVPRPQLLDVDGDGDDDLFVQERSGEIMFFERVASVDTGRVPPFAWRSDAYRGLAVGEWFRFGDVDMDGDPDLLAERPFSHVRYYRNEGGPTDPSFVPAADTLRRVDGEPIFSDRQNVPNVGDVDCDGLQDLLVGRLDGTVTRFEIAEGAGGAAPPDTAGRSGDGAPRFRLVTERFQDIEIVAEFARGIRHGANSLVVTDFDGDGDPDLFWGDFFEAGLLYIENTGSCESPYLRGRPVPFPPEDPLVTSGFNAPTFGDLDGDGDRDLLVGVIGGAYNPLTTSADNLWYLENTDAGWELRTRRFLPGLDVGSESQPALADLDGDGDAELLLAGKIDPAEQSSSVIHRWENAGGPSRPDWRPAGSLPMRGAYQYAPAFGDLDGDGRADLVLGDWRDRLAWYRAGEEGFTLADSAAAVLTRGSHAVPALGDVDGDGDLDLFVGESSGSLNFFRNVGDASRPSFELASDAYGGIDVGRRSSPALGDVDGDGDLDLLVGSGTEGIRLFRNRGSASRPDFVDAGRLDAPTRGLSAPALHDVDGDGTPELFSGSASGGLLFFERGEGDR